MPHLGTPSRTPATIALLILLASVGLAACGSGGSSSTSTTQTTANAAATSTATTGTKSSGTAPVEHVPKGAGVLPPTGRPNAARFGAMRACLAKKGITLPKRTPGAGGFLGGAGGGLPKGVTRAQFAEALKSCGGGSFGSGHFNRVPHAFTSPAFHQGLARFAACLRQNGVNVGEPNTTGKGPVFDTKGINTGSPQFKAAETKCRSVLFSRPPGATPGAAGAPPG